MADGFVFSGRGNAFDSMVRIYICGVLSILPLFLARVVYKSRVHGVMVNSFNSNLFIPASFV